MKKQLLTAAIAMMAVAVFAQQDNQFTVDAQLRTRGEYNNGASTPRAEGQLPETFINNRARLTLGYQRDNLEVKVGVQHTGLWGANDMNASDGQATINEAWAKLNIGAGFYAKVGRQQLVYDDERILGGLDWHVSGNWHDALLLGHSEGNSSSSLILAFNQATNNNKNGNFYDGPMPYKSMQTVHHHYQSDMMPLGVSLLIMNLGRESGVAGHGKTKYMQTIGGDLTFKPAEWDFHAALYYQTGKNVADQKVSAWMASAKVGYKISPEVGVNVGYDYRSGNDGKSDKDKAFDQLFGTHHKFYGFMDYWLRTVPNGLQDIQGGITYKASEKTNLLLNYHYFLTTCDMGNLDKSLGHEIDLQLTTKLARDVTLMAGYSTMLGTETMDAVKRGNHKSWQDWGWVQLNINPRLFFTRW